MSTTDHKPEPAQVPGSITNRWGASVNGATRQDYPLRGFCAECGEPIRCADGTADWAHR
jgi:hypothetical protein